MSEEQEDDTAAAELDPEFPYRIRPVDWSWLREPIPRNTAEDPQPEAE